MQGELFLYKAFYDRWVNKHFWPNLWEVAVLHEGLMIRSCQGQVSFTNALFSNLKSVNMKMFLQAKIFLRTWRDIHLKIKPWPVYRIMEGFILEVNTLEVSQNVSWSAWLWHIAWKSNSTNRRLNLKNILCTLFLEGWGFHAKPNFVFDIFNGGL